MAHENITHVFKASYFIKLFSCVLFAIVLVHYVDAKLRIMQEGAVVKFKNEKYITDVQVFTVRRRRNSPYLTNITATIHQPWGNNVTCKFSYMIPGGISIDFGFRICEALNKPWVLEFVMTYSNLTACPTPPGTYRYYNVELPPKNFPLPLPPGLKKGDSGDVNVKFFKTARNLTTYFFGAQLCNSEMGRVVVDLKKIAKMYKTEV